MWIKPFSLYYTLVGISWITIGKFEISNKPYLKLNN